ncbi:uncharacterized protein LOC118457631 isoform X1 [Anopheles albimanus]|uniref:uncharacterized protein LOC118457631 isoform X1 n=1 Tax=Anopheles albimanus TaxID=7167 RepID=UPI001641FA82|nr:uncharacterized protein LOC118457631 isoform X1 [Anopheles albimanus]
MQNARTMCMVILLLIVGFVGAENLLFSDCGVRMSRRQPRSYFPIELGATRRMDNGSVSIISSQPEAFVRNPKIMHGTPTVEGQYPWQVSLELLHPSYGFIGHWCGGVLIDRNWVLSAAHCIHNDLFNLPLPALWTVVLGEYDRRTESGYEQRIPVDKIILHEKYHNFKHDLVLLKLTRPANTSPSSRVRKICLPFADFKVNSIPFDPRPEQQERPKPNDKPAYFFDRDAAANEEQASSSDDQRYGADREGFPDAVPFRDDNFLRRLKQSFELDAFTGRSNRSRTARFMVNQLVVGKLRSTDSHRRTSHEPSSARIAADRRSFQFPVATRREGRHIITKPSLPIEKRNRRMQLRSKHFRPLAETVKKDSNPVNHYQYRRVSLNSKFGNNRRRNDKFSHAPVYYRNEPNYRNEDLSDYSLVDDATVTPARGTGVEVDAEAESISAAMPDTSQYVDCLATGWGKSTIDDELTDVLLQTRAPIQSSKKCEEAYGDFIKLHRGHLCAGNLDGAGGTCVGDSGGPLQCRISKRGPWILVGITSFGSGCAFKNYPDVYTKISFYRQWIADTIEQN